MNTETGRLSPSVPGVLGGLGEINKYPSSYPQIFRNTSKYRHVGACLAGDIREQSSLLQERLQVLELFHDGQIGGGEGIGR